MKAVPIKPIINCVIDARVSSDRQLDGYGIEDQEERCLRFADSKGWHVANVFCKSYSGRKQERLDFEEIKNFIKKCRKTGNPIHYYVIKSIDRFTRKGALGYLPMKQELSELGVELIDVYGVIQPEQNTMANFGLTFDWSLYSPSDTTQLFEAERAKSEVREILTRMIGAEVQMVREGYSIRGCVDGYRNTKEVINGKERPIVEVDEVRAKFYRMMFQLRADGRYSDEKIVEKLNALGYKSKPHKRWDKSTGKNRRVIGYTKGKPMTVKQLQKSIRRTMYAGLKNEKWNEGKPVWAIMASGSEAIVSVDTFNRANRGSIFIRVNEDRSAEILYNYTEKEPTIKSRKKYHPEYKYDKMVLCAACRKPLKNSGRGNKGKLGKYYQGYHCNRSKDCKKETGRIPKSDYDKALSGLLARIKFSDSFERKLEQRLIKKYRDREKEVPGQSITIAENVTRLKQEQQALLDDYSASESMVTKKMLEGKIEALEKRIEKATEERDKIEIQERDIKSFVRYTKDLVEHPVKKLANNKNPLFQKALFDLVFDEPLTYAQIVSGTPKLSFIFKLSGTQKSTETALVTQLGPLLERISKFRN